MEWTRGGTLWGGRELAGDQARTGRGHREIGEKREVGDSMRERQQAEVVVLHHQTIKIFQRREEDSRERPGTRPPADPLIW